MKYRPPFFLGLQIDEELGVEKARGVRPVVGPAHLAGTMWDLRKGAQYGASLIRHTGPFGLACTRRQYSAHPDSALVEVRQELGTEHTRREINRQCEAG